MTGKLTAYCCYRWIWVGIKLWMLKKTPNKTRHFILTNSQNNKTVVIMTELMPIEA